MTPVEEQLAVLLHGVEQVLPADEFNQKLTAAARGERPPLRVKLGLDPTRPDLHLGHTVVLRKLRDFQRFGHTAVLIVGGFTALVGDPSGRSQSRPRLTPEEVAVNARTYLDQAGKVLLPEPLEVVDNATWLAPMALPDVLQLTAQMTVARMLERSDFADRYRRGRPIAVLEFLYPLLQGHDSVAVSSDVELGGTDQTFNLLVGRDLQQGAGLAGQCVLTMPLIEGLDGSAKMSKSAGNTIDLDDQPAEMFGKTMRLPDSLVEKYFRLVTDLDPQEVEVLAAALAAGSLHPAAAKRRLAREIVSLFHPAGAATAAEARFDAQFRDHEVPADIPQFALGDQQRWFLPTLLQAAGLAASGSEARRRVQEGAVRLDGVVLTDPTADLEAADLRGAALQVGRRRFVRLA